MKAVNRIIDSVWTIEYELVPENPNAIKLLRYSRNDPEGYEREHELPKGRLVESPHRLVVAAEIGGLGYDVENKKHVFDYGA